MYCMVMTLSIKYLVRFFRYIYIFLTPVCFLSCVEFSRLQYLLRNARSKSFHVVISSLINCHQQLVRPSRLDSIVSNTISYLDTLSPYNCFLHVIMLLCVVFINSFNEFHWIVHPSIVHLSTGSAVTH